MARRPPDAASSSSVSRGWVLTAGRYPFGRPEGREVLWSGPAFEASRYHASVTERLEWRAGPHVLVCGIRTLVMGVLNVTPDSFSDGGRFFEPEVAVAQGIRMAADGADLIDVGGESTRPGSDPVGAEEEIRRAVPVIERLAAELAVPISIDTRKAEVAGVALEAGATVVN